MAENYCPRLGLDTPLDLIGEPGADRASLDPCPTIRWSPTEFGWSRALGDHDDREVTALALSCPDPLADHLDIEGVLGDEYHICAPSNPSISRDPSRMVTHHLYDYDPVVGLSGRMQPIDRIGRDPYSGIETESRICCGEIVIDRLRDTYEFEPLLGEFGGGRERSIPADDDQSFDPIGVQGPAQPLEAIGHDYRVGPCGAEDGPTEWQDPLDRLAVEGHRSPFDDPLPAIFVAQESYATLHTPARRSPDYGIEAGAIPPTGHDTQGTLWFNHPLPTEKVLAVAHCMPMAR